MVRVFWGNSTGEGSAGAPPPPACCSSSPRMTSAPLRTPELTLFPRAGSEHTMAPLPFGRRLRASPVCKPPVITPVCGVTYQGPPPGWSPQGPRYNSSSSNVLSFVLGPSGCLLSLLLTSGIFTLTGLRLQCSSYCFPFLCLREDHGWKSLSALPFWLSVSAVPEDLANATSLPVQEGQSLRLVCETNSEAPARLSWSRGSLTLNPSNPLHPGVLELCHVVSGDGGEFTCRAQHPQVFLHVSLKLVVWGESMRDTCVLRWSHEQH